MAKTPKAKAEARIEKARVRAETALQAARARAERKIAKVRTGLGKAEEKIYARLSKDLQRAELDVKVADAARFLRRGAKAGRPKR